VTLQRDFYDRPSLEVARDLLGKVLVHSRNGVRTSGAIVEVEAYIGESDPACHAAPGRTRRNAPLYGLPGFSYVYLNYGIHCLMNVVTEEEHSPAAVLIRALEPLDGVPAMRRRRGRNAKGRRRTAGAPSLHELCRGPGNLTMSMGITLEENWLDLSGSRLFIDDASAVAGEVEWGPRVGIRVGTERPWRAWFTGHPAVSASRGTTAVREKLGRKSLAT